jgi:hypothetical protein
LIIAACGSDPATSNNAQQMTASPPIPKSITGYGSLEFGSSFKNVISDLGGDLFNPVGVSECFKDLPLKGCRLSRNMENTPFEMKGGIPYTLSLAFNKWDKLTDVGLNYDREGDISRADWLQIHERTLDWVSGEYGSIRFSAAAPEADSQHARRKTARGNLYEVSSRDNQFFVTTPMRTISSALPTVAEKRPITQWNQERYVSILSTFIVVDSKPICSVNVDFSGPEAVERAVY